MKIKDQKGTVYQIVSADVYETLTSAKPSGAIKGFETIITDEGAFARITAAAGLFSTISTNGGGGKSCYIVFGRTLYSSPEFMAELATLYPFQYTTIIRFNDAEMGESPKTVIWADAPNRNTRRSREHRTILYCKNYATTFMGDSIDGMCVSNLENSTKNGKWSDETYRIDLMAGVKSVSIQEDWNTGSYINTITSVKAMIAQLGLDGITPAAAVEFFKRELPTEWQRHETFLAEMSKMEEQGITETMSYVFVASIDVNRQGWKWLLLDGELWHPQPELNTCPVQVVLKQHEHLRGPKGGVITYHLELPAGTEVEEIYEGGYEGDDTLQTRGYIERGGTWVKPDAADTNTPFKGLFK